MMKFITFILTSLLGLSLASAQSVCVGKEYQNPMELLLEAYGEARILGWGVTNHTSGFESSYALSKLLNEVGTDENLKYVFVELPTDLTGPLKEFSEGKITLSGLGQQAGHFAAYFDGRYPEHQVSKDAQLVYTKIAALNRSRTNKIQIVPIDSYQNISGQEKHQIMSWDREKETAATFQSYYSTMKAQEKAIVIYQAFHLARNIQGKTLDSDGGEHTGAFSFMNMVRMGSEEYKVVVFDDSDADQKFFRRQETSYEGLAYKMSASATRADCMKQFALYFDRQFGPVTYPKNLNQAFHYVVPRSAETTVIFTSR